MAVLSRLDDHGFSLVEVLIAMSLIAVISGGVASLIGIATKAVARSSAHTTATLAASVRLEQLKGLAWGFGSGHAPEPGADRVTDLSGPDPRTGGPGLGTAPAMALDVNTPGYVDYLDSRGRWLGTDDGSSASARFIRRWSVGPIAGWPDTVLLQVRVVDALHLVDDVHLYVIRARTAG